MAILTQYVSSPIYDLVRFAKSEGRITGLPYRHPGWFLQVRLIPTEIIGFNEHKERVQGLDGPSLAMIKCLDIAMKISEVSWVWITLIDFDAS